MGILTLLRNAFGRSRKPRATEPEGAPETPEQPPVPEPRQSSTEEHDLVAAAFDKVKVPHQAPPAVQQTDEPPTTNPETAKPESNEPRTAAEPEPTEPNTAAEPRPIADATAEPDPEPKAETETAPKPEEAPEPTAPTEPEPETVTETGREPEAATETAATPEPEPKPTAEPKPEPEAAAEPAPKATPEPAPDTEAADPDPVAEAAAEPEPKTAADPEPVSAAAAESEPEPKAAAEPEPTAAAAEPKTKTAPAREAEAAAPVAPQPEPPTETDPQAADGEDAPQGPPAPDHATRTGGAGGNTTAEGEAEATTVTAPQGPARDNEPRTDAEGEADAPPKPKPATPLTRVKSRTPALAAAYKAATTTLRKKNLTGTRAKLYLVLDRSASMRPYYKDGSAQSLADQTLALAAHLDPGPGPDPTVHVVFFSTEVDGTTDLTLAPGHDTKIDDVHAGLGRMGRTSYHAAVAAVLDHYDTHVNVNSDTVPALVVFQTDGAPDAKTPATQALTEAAKTHPGVFFSFVAFGDHDNKAFDYLRRLKTPNASFFHAGPAPRELTDTELYEGVLADWRP
ncbi:VWA domain-containing protein [Streptomyces sp. CSDS2]|uniref:VWA domain-containing protein n=1 Tax=Streptomyces sp. CSDS2 TaxID=3055051 RepID=UPI0025AFC6D7|nr:VWA domain-containing protein [Streptomyces sp. CSDS2]MDN3261826.1 VWA domain-containing protein [Streptomyces sp. CSDS2]